MFIIKSKKRGEISMVRPTTKKDLIQSSNESYHKLIDLLESMSKQQLENVFDFDIEHKKEAHWKRDKNTRDVLIHLVEWQNLLLNWIEFNQKDIKKPFLEEGYNWRTYGEMNVKFWRKHQNTSFEESLEALKSSHIKVMDLIQTFSNEELFTKGIFDWVGGSTLGSYFVANSSSHYNWAIKKIKKHQKSAVDK